MSYEEKGALVQLVIAVVGYAVYLVLILGRAAGGPLVAVPYVPILLWTIGGAILAGIVGRIALELARPSDSYLSDVRDREIGQHGERIGQGPLIAAALAALLMALAEWDYFWIANVIYLGFVLHAIVSNGVKLLAYRRGL